MTNDAEIVLIERPEQEQAIGALVAAKRAYSLEELARMEPVQIDEVLRQFYLQAVDRKVIRLINLWVRALAPATSAGVHEWRSVAVAGDVPTVVSYDLRSGTTRAMVGDLVVLSNEVPGRELMRPGDWLYRLRDAYQLHQAGVRHAQEVAIDQEAGRKVTDFLAEV